jgi:NAD+ synthase
MSEVYYDHVVEGLKERAEKAGAKGFVLGLSGGVDSAVAYGLALRTGLPVKPIFIGIESSDEDKIHARDVWFSQDVFPDRLILVETDLTEVYNKKVAKYSVEMDYDAPWSDSVPCQNLKARTRMEFLYWVSNNENLLVIGTDNLCETMVGYFTKFGDGACDVAPLANYYKSDVYKIADDLLIPDEVLHKPPSAGLANGQTDEEDMGVTYPEIEKHLKGEEESEKVAELIKKSQHKREPPATW